jgi:hypothetical protein
MRPATSATLPRGLPERPFDPEGRQWLKESCLDSSGRLASGAPGGSPDLKRRSFGRAGRISLIEGAGRNVSSRALEDPLDSGTARQVLAQASQEVTSISARQPAYRFSQSAACLRFTRHRSPGVFRRGENHRIRLRDAPVFASALSRDRYRLKSGGDPRFQHGHRF